MRPLIGFLLGVFVCEPPARAVTNLLPDGDFEKANWKLTRWDRGEGRMEFADEGRRGKAVKLTGINGTKARINLLAHSPATDVRAGREYVLSLWHRSAGRAAPAVSIFTYKEPWATAQWRTPPTAYETRRLPPAEHWSPWTWRFRVAPGSVQLVVAVRNGGVGTVWFDDVALFEADDARLTVVEPGTVTGLPDKRRLRADVALRSAGAGWKLSLSDQASGRLLASQESASAPKTVEFHYVAPDHARLLLALEEAASGAVLATENIAVPPLVAFEMISPRYRNSIYLSQKPKTVRARLQCNADDNVRKGMALAVQAGAQQTQLWRPLRAENELRVPVSIPRGANSLALTVLLKGVPGRDRFTAVLKVVPPAPAGREVIIGDHNETVVDGKPFFPAGFYGPRVGPSFDPIAKAGYTAALTYETNPERCKAWLDDCRRIGLLGMVSVPRPFVTKLDESKLRDAIRVVKHHPALLAYYLFDEPAPGNPGQSVTELKRVYDVVADEDPYHPIGVCICVPEYFGIYVECYDMLMPDPYPLVKARRPLTWVSQWMDAAREAVADRKPVWVVPQAFGWDIIENIPDPETYRTPTPAQERCITYLALTHGARAVMYYCYHVYTGYDAAKKKAGGFPYILGGYLPDKQPALWSALEKLGPEMRRLGPALLRPGAREGLTGFVHWRKMPRAGADSAWLIAVNADESSAASVKLPLARVKPLKVFFGDGAIAAAADGV
ncbi:MAG: hypothetical protein N2689_11720, partial [Verrucomicrobiae bacterium]|nr:hypothetical protein [Verrucomicrobiae bacterium]